MIQLELKPIYNEKIPHYQLAYALYNKNTKKFNKYIDPSIHLNNEATHNKMHNMNFFSMIDDNFSLTNLMFFPYHSWIDTHL